MGLIQKSCKFTIGVIMAVFPERRDFFRYQQEIYNNGMNNKIVFGDD